MERFLVALALLPTVRGIGYAPICYEFELTSARVGWNECAADCAAKFGREWAFACIDDQSQNDKAFAAFGAVCPPVGTLLERKKKGFCGAWIAVNDMSLKDDWVCTADGVTQAQTYFSWDTNSNAAGTSDKWGTEPNNGITLDGKQTGAEDCAHMWAVVAARL